MAAGMTLSREHLPELARRLAKLAEEWLTAEDWIPLLQADMECRVNEVGLDSIEQLEQLGPFGMGNPLPRFVFSGLKLSDMRTMGKEQQHLKLTLRSAVDEAAPGLDAVGFSKARLAEWISPSAMVDILGELSINEWNGVRRPQIMIQDLRVPHVQLFDWRGTPRPDKKLIELCERLERRGSRTECGPPPAVVLFAPAVPAALRSESPAFSLWRVDLQGRLLPVNELAAVNRYEEAQDVIVYALPDRLEQLDAAASQADAVQRYYAVFGGSEEDKEASVMPNRDMFKSVYGTVSALQSSAAQAGGTAGFIRLLSKRCSLSALTVSFILDVFTELGLMKADGDVYRLIPTPDKKDLTASALYQARMNRPSVEQELLYSSANELLSQLVGRRKQSSPAVYLRSSGA